MLGGERHLLRRSRGGWHLPLPSPVRLAAEGTVLVSWWVRSQKDIHQEVLGAWGGTWNRHTGEEPWLSWEGIMEEIQPEIESHSPA